MGALLKTSHLFMNDGYDLKKGGQNQHFFPEKKTVIKL